MSFISTEELKQRSGLQIAPMVDFLFLLLIFFATMALVGDKTRTSDIELVELDDKGNSSPSSSPGDSDIATVNIALDSLGRLKWLADLHDYPLETPAALAEELQRQWDKGLLPEDKSKTTILLRIDKATPWEPILNTLFAIRDAGFEGFPTYLPRE